MKIAVLASPESWYVRDLARAAAARHEIVQAPFDQISSCTEFSASQAKYETHVSAGPIDLSSFEAVLVRTMPPGSLEQVVFRMDALAALEQAGVLVLNPPKAIEAAVDKFLTTARLAAGGLPTPRTLVCQTVDAAMEAFERLGRDVIVKPIFGGEGRGITRVSDDAIAWRVFSTIIQLRAVIYLQEFVSHSGYDLRVLLIGDEPFAMRRESASDYRTNISRGAIGKPHKLTDEELELARRSASLIGAPLAGVDLLRDASGKLYVIEVNGVPGWQATSRVLGIDIAAKVLAYVETLGGKR